MHSRSYRKLSTFSLSLGVLGLLALMGGCPTGDFTLPGINQDPTADTGADRTIDVGQRVTLNALGSTDADDDALTFIWQQLSGPSVTLDDANTAQPSFVPVEDGFYEFALTVTDGRGGSDISAVLVFVGDVDPATCPRADAGTDQTVNEGAAVRLRGGNSADPGGGPLTFDWLQLSGPQVSINGVFIVEPSFATPQVTGADIELEFELTVTNEQGCPDRDTVVITVRDRPPSDLCNGFGCDDDGQFCNGVEICENGVCLSTGDPCREEETCDDETDTCTAPPCDTDADCDDGLFCNGGERCVAAECQTGDARCATDETCDDETDTCTAPPCDTDVDCDDGLFCSGEETCVDGSCVAGTNPCAGDENGLIAKWNLDGDAIDATGNGHDGVVHGATPAADRLGNPAGAMVFDGTNDYIEVPDSDHWAFGSNDFTIALWAHFDSTGSGSIGRPGDVFIGNDEGPYTRNKWFFALGGGVLNFHINGPGTGSVFMPHALFSPTVDQWYHLAVTRNDSTYTIFIDGNPVASTEDTRAIPNANASLMIGRANESWGGFMNGRLDEIAVYDRALSDPEVRAFFASGDDGSPSSTQDETCDEETDSCTAPPECTSDADCDDALFCNGEETCVGGSCAVGTNPCAADETCDEDTDSCVTVECNVDADCDDDDACTTDRCVADTCANIAVVCDADQACRGLTGVCETICADDVDCDDTLFCSGVETCVDDFCQAGVAPCIFGETCDEENDECPPDADTIHSSEWLADAIDTVVDIDTYTFSGQAGQLVFIQANRTSGGLDPQIQLFPPNGGDRETYANPSSGIALLQAHPLAESGQYSILIRDYGGDETGEYMLSLLNLSGALTSSEDQDGGDIDFDEARSGTIDTAADLDAYTFTGEAGQVVFIQANRMSDGLDPQILLFPPNSGDRETYANPSSGIALLSAHALAESGEYTILIRDYGGDETGEYIMSLSGLP